MRIISKSKSIHVDKPDGTSVNYYLFPEYEIHYNSIAPHTTQQWHHHQKIIETILILEGQIEAHWSDESNIKHHQLVYVGDIIEVGNSPHTFINNSQEKVNFIVFRFMPTGVNQSETIKKDKIVDTF